ncbi:hypothetical protein CRM22_001533 [Opisthorchis felineus]|uniref:Uncharacterized protein n=1 Tax=Opisthorchis felineus TaxID=147828 RepID=A0A4S2MA55_OPIFE|nr:hypothetical protein CRM22_001533 [Opisthorchis felineus]
MVFFVGLRRAVSKQAREENGDLAIRKLIGITRDFRSLLLMDYSPKRTSCLHLSAALAILV